MSVNGIDNLVAVTEMMFQVEQGKMRRITGREAELRTSIAKLDNAQKSSMALPAIDLNAMRQTGADVQWCAWLGQRRAELNRQLALVLAQKEHLIASLRLAHGRKSAADQINLDKRTSRNAVLLKREVTELEMLGALKSKKRPNLL